MKNRLCLGLIFAMSLSGLLWGEPSTVPFSDDFEDYAVDTPLVDGLNGWYGSEPEVKVQDQIAYSGQAAQVPLDCSLSNRFTGAAHSSLWMRIHTRPVLHDNQPEIETNAAISFYINQEGYFVVHDGPPTNWVELTHNITGEPMTPLTGAEWVQIDIYQDFTTKTWDLYVNYNLITNQIGFINPSIASLHGLGFYNGITATSYIDNVWVIATKPPDLATNANNWLPHIVVDATNIECSVLEGIVDHSTTYAVWETNGYYPLGFTNSISGLSGAQDWLQLSPATGTSTGQPTTVTLTFSTEGLEPGVYTGLVTVAGQDTRFGFPAGNSPSYIPVTMRVETNLPVLCCEPLVLDQTIVKGSNPTNQIFEIWNDSAAPVIPMAFEMTCAYSGPTNFSLSFTNGVSSGERFTSAVVFSDMSEYDSGSYTGRITISAWDAWPGYKPPLAQVLTTNLLVTVKIVGMEPPAGIWASEGTYTDQVAIHWDPAEGAASYELWRGTTFDLDYAEKISEVGSTNYADTTAVPGNLYYYWVRPVNPRGVIGSMSAYATGYRALAAPDSVLATKAVYTNRVIVQWSLAEGASSYHVYRSLLGKPETQQIVYRAGGLEYTDSQAQDGECYYYQVQSTKGPFNSALSTGDFGCVLSSPQQLKATKGTLAAQVRLSWKAVEGATSYEIWRHSSAQPQAATLLGLATQAAYNDKAVTPSVTYYYWIKAKNATALSGFSRMDHGYTAMGDVALTLRQLVLKPTILPVSSSPALASFRLRNNGPMDLAAPHTALEISFLMGLTPEISAAQLVGTVKQNVTLAAGTETVVRLNQPHKIRMPTAPGTYYLFCRAAPVAPNRLLDGSQGHNETIGVGRIHVQGTGQARYWSVNDYSGDGLSDLTAYTPAQGTWDVRTVAGQVLGQNVLFGAPGFIPVPGDYDGDHLADPALYDPTSGLWAAMLSGSGYAIAYSQIGSPDHIPMPGDYDGDGKADIVVYHKTTGLWEGFLSASGYAYASDFFGASDYLPVPGDYDGDGLWDLAVYNASLGAWYIRTADGTLLQWGKIWGGPGLYPVPGDYDGDGVWDLAMYAEATGKWYIQTMAGQLLAYAVSWGGPGFQPVPGDYDGDGLWDLAVYNASLGAWYARTLQGRYIFFNTPWGTPAAEAVTWTWSMPPAAGGGPEEEAR